MCCRACLGYEVCQAKQALRDDCCQQCRYFEDCMEKSADEDADQHPNHASRRPYRPTRK
jgi:hypothetical protein